MYVLSDDTLKLRIRFCKHGLMKYIGHLDVMRYFQKVMRRANIPIAYSGGYSPHQIMSFAQPLGVGIESDGEYMDIEIYPCASASSSSIKEAMNSSGADGIYISDVVRLPSDAKGAMASVAMADYTAEIVGNGVLCAEASAFSGSFEDGASKASKDGFADAKANFQKVKAAADYFKKSDHLFVEKKTKKSTQTLDLKEFVYSLDFYDAPDAESADGRASLKMCLCAGSQSNIKPSLLLEALELSDFAFRITRTEIRSEDGRALIDMGQRF